MRAGLLCAESTKKLKSKQSVRIEKFYKLGRKIGSGGFAEVQEATDIRTGKVCVHRWCHIHLLRCVSWMWLTHWPRACTYAGTR